MSLQPLAATSPSGLPHQAQQVEAIAAALGWELLPWQVQAARILTEQRPDGRWRYPVVTISTPRQSGKSTLIGSLLLQRAMTQTESLNYYTAQTGLAARGTWTKWVDRLGARIGYNGFRVIRGMGTEMLRMDSTLGVVKPFPRMEKALHGEQTDTVVLDECWELEPDTGEGLLQAVVPTQATRPRRQLILISTAGSEESIWWRSWIRRGRAAVTDPDSEHAHLEWGCPEGEDPTDATLWPQFHPGYPTLIDDYAMTTALAQFGRDGFVRGYGNQWPREEDTWRGAWPEAASDVRIPTDVTPVLAVDAGPSHQFACIAAAALVDGQVVVEIIDYRRGVDWLVERITDLTRTHGATMLIQRTGPVGYLIPDLEARGARIRVVPADEGYAAVGRWKAFVREGRITHPDDPRLNAAVENALTRVSGEREYWRRIDLAVDLSPLVAATLAANGAAVPKQAPVIASS